jgi:hypothetical protein
MIVILSYKVDIKDNSKVLKLDEPQVKALTKLLEQAYNEVSQKEETQRPKVQKESTANS